MISSIFAVILFIVGMVLSLFGIYVFFSYLSFVRKSKATSGKLVSQGMFRVGAGPAHGYYTPKIKFLLSSYIILEKNFILAPRLVLLLFVKNSQIKRIYRLYTIPIIQKTRK